MGPIPTISSLCSYKIGLSKLFNHYVTLRKSSLTRYYNFLIRSTIIQELMGIQVSTKSVYLKSKILEIYYDN